MKIITQKGQIVKDEKKYISKLASLIPVLSIVFLVYSTVEIFFYYRFFNFNIMPFLEISEFLPLTLFDFIITTLGILVCLIICVAIKLYLSRKLSFIVFFIIGFVFLLNISFDLFKKNYSQLVDTDLYLLTTFISAILIFSVRKIGTILPEIPELTVTGCLVLLLIIGNGKYRAFNKFYDVMYNDHYLNTYILIDKKPMIKSNHEYFYIGKCKSDFVFYSRKTNGVDLYPTNVVLQAYIYSR